MQEPWIQSPESISFAATYGVVLCALCSFVLLMLLLVLAAPFIMLWHRSVSHSGLMIARLAKLFVIVSILGAIAQIPWSTLVYGRLYVSTDYVFGFLPFIPITQGEINAEFGGKIGALKSGISLAHLNLIWLIHASLVWVGAWWLRDRVFRHLSCHRRFPLAVARSETFA